MNILKSKRGIILLSSLILLTLIAIGIGLGIWAFKLNSEIETRLSEKRFAPPVEFFSAPEKIYIGTQLPSRYLESLFDRKHFRNRDFGLPLQPGDYSLWTSDNCKTELSFLDSQITSQIQYCISFRNTNSKSMGQLIALDLNQKVLATFSGTPPTPSQFVEVEPELFAQYYGKVPILRKIVPLGETPAYCLNALLSIEDSEFYEHGAISFSGTLRALLANIRSGRKAQGGSTLTQQLVKNYFLTSERSYRRKIKEFVMSIILENHASKDDILETYINLIFMGVTGPFEVRGFAAASDFYFGTELRDLNLEQCALLAALVNGPGLYNPYTHPENALKRRSKVLDRMQELGHITSEQAQQAKNSLLPQKNHRSLSEPAPYFVSAVRKQIAQMDLDESQGLKVYTSLNLRAQEAAHQAIKAGIESLEKNFKNIAKLKAESKNIEALLISGNPETGDIEALIGGRSFNATQYNRAIESHRQVGSIMKPVVYLTAIDSGDFTPTTIVKDEAFTYEYQNQSWSPKNYDGKFFGEIPLYFGLKESLNAATASTAIKVGLQKIVDTARKLGITSSIEPLPSLSLGAFELYPWEVLQAYSTLSQFGKYNALTLIHTIEDLDSHILYEYQAAPEQRYSAQSTAILVGMMKQTILNGTARSIRLNGFQLPTAGKTGTTNDKKDAWFAGFTPHHVAIAWVGYDDNTSHNLTGASGAVPIWLNYMKNYSSQLSPDDFKWPEDTQLIRLSVDEQKKLGVPERKAEALEEIELVVKK